MMNLTRFECAIIHNARVLNQQTLAQSFQPQEYVMVNRDGTFLMPNKHPAHTVRKLDDIIASTVIGALPYNTQNGVDAFIIDKCGTYIPIECKFAMTSKNTFFVGQRNGIFHTRLNRINEKPASITCVRSYISARYDIVNNFAAKGIDTYFVVQDSDTWEFITALKLPGDKIVGLLNRNKRQIKLSTFYNHGCIPDVKVPLIGLENWEDQIRKVRPKYPFVKNP